MEPYFGLETKICLLCQPTQKCLKCITHALNMQSFLWVCVWVFWLVHSAPVHLHVWTSFPQCSRAESTSKSDLTLSRVFITSSCFRFISPNWTFLEKSLYCDILLLLWSPRSPAIAFPLAPCVILFPSPHSASTELWPHLFDAFVT